MAREIRGRVDTATALATGAEGPVRAALDQLRRYGLGERVIKSALAAALAWWIAYAIHADPLPVLAPLTAIFTIQLTLVRSWKGSVQRLAGVGGGIATAMIAAELLGVEWYTIALIVLFSFVAGLRLFRLEPAGVEQMTVSALLVMVVGASGGIVAVAAYHFLDTLIGTAVGLAANALIAPPSHVPRARAAVHALGRRLIAVQEELAGGLADGIDQDRATAVLTSARVVAAELDEVQDILDQAKESLRFNLTARRQQPALARYSRANHALEHAALQTRVISRTVLDSTGRAPHDGPRPAWLEPDVLGTPLANLVSSIALYLDHFLALADDPARRSDDLPLIREISGRRAEMNAATTQHMEALLPDHWVLVGEIVSISDQLVADLTAAAADLWPNGPVSSRSFDDDLRADDLLLHAVERQQ